MSDHTYTIRFALVICFMFFAVGLWADAMRTDPLPAQRVEEKGTFGGYDELETKKLIIADAGSPYKIALTVDPNGAWIQITKTGDKGYLGINWGNHGMEVLANRSGNGETIAGVGVSENSGTFLNLTDSNNSIINTWLHSR